jgi:DNA integrity scanning protein DisA with diadenylate cyclase activity
MRDKIEKLLIEISLKIARQGKGCLFVIKEKNLDYENLLEQDVKPFNIFENQRRLEALALIDGACIIDQKGNLIAYGVSISNTKVFLGYGTRHSASYTASLNGNTAIMSSEEDKKVRIFKKGKLIMQLDPLEKRVNNKVSEAVNILESMGFGVTATYGLTALVPNLSPGLQIFPGIILFGSAYALIKFLAKK